MSSSASTTNTITKPSSSPAVESVTCVTCGFSEECTPAYINSIKERHQGYWLCGLCSEVVKDELARSSTSISVEEALCRHAMICHGSRSLSLKEENGLVSLTGRVLRRSLEGSSLRKTIMRMNSRGDLVETDTGVSPRRFFRGSGSCSPSSLST